MNKISIDWQNLVVNIKGFAKKNDMTVSEVTKGINEYTNISNIDYANQVVKTIREDRYDANTIIVCMINILDKQGDEYDKEF
jgi:uncharacterized membrane protein YjjP (DUF1212 family)